MTSTTTLTFTEVFFTIDWAIKAVSAILLGFLLYNADPRFNPRAAEVYSVIFQTVANSSSDQVSTETLMVETVAKEPSHVVSTTTARRKFDSRTYSFPTVGFANDAKLLRRYYEAKNEREIPKPKVIAPVHDNNFQPSFPPARLPTIKSMPSENGGIDRV